MKAIAMLRLVGALACAAAAHAAGAATSSFAGTISDTDPTMPVVTITTPECTGVGALQVPYRAIPFSVDANGAYTITAPNAGVAILVYAGGFNPASPLTNCIAASNVNPHILVETLATGTAYVLVVADDLVATPGARFDVTITGPGDIHGPCAAFPDVDAASPFCAGVHWIRNRGITLGCGADAYCPNDAVTRLQMAAFLSRMGEALMPRYRGDFQQGVQNVVNADGVVCQTQDFEVTNYPRIATVVSAMLTHRAAASVEVAARIVFSRTQGTSWVDLGTPTRAANVAGQFVSQSPASGALELDVDEVVRFGIATDAAAATLTDANCQINVRIESRTGTTPPFDLR